MTRDGKTNTIDEAKKLVLGGRCVAFIGAGLSIPPGGGWKDIVKTFASRCNVDFNNQDLPKVIDECFDTKPSEYKKVFQELFPKHTSTSRTAINYLPRLPFKAFITTNFDPWLRNLFRASDIVGVYSYPDIPMTKGLSKNVYYIHGYYDSTRNDFNHENLVFGERSFLCAYGTESLLPGFLLNLFVYENVLFIGFDPSEENISRILEKSEKVKVRLKENDFKKPKRFLLWPAFTQATEQPKGEYEARIKNFQSLGIDPIIYDYKGEDYRGIEEILYSWVEQSEIKNRPAPFKSGFDL